MSDPSPITFTVAICTYQRLEALGQTLRSLAECEPAGALWELIVVDNACDSGVEQLVASFADKLPAPVRYLAESTLGTSFARNRAV